MNVVRLLHCRSGKMKQLIDAYETVMHKMHIFGFKPGIKMEWVIPENIYTPDDTQWMGSSFSPPSFSRLLVAFSQS